MSFHAPINKSSGGDKSSSSKTSINNSSSTQSSIHHTNIRPYTNRREYIMYLQRTIGNRAVERLWKSGYLQKKLGINISDDKYEKKADQVAEKITSDSKRTAPNTSNEAPSKKSLAGQISRLPKTPNSTPSTSGNIDIQNIRTKSELIQRVQLTYDDGPDESGYTQQILEALNHEGAKATFYLVGKRVNSGSNYKVVFNIAKSGHWLGNHAFDWDNQKDQHIWLKGSIAERTQKILLTEFAIRNALIKGKAEAIKNHAWENIPIDNRNYIEDVISKGTGRFRTPGFQSKFWRENGRKNSEALEVTNDILTSAGLRPVVRTMEYLGNIEGVDVDPEDYAQNKTVKEINDFIISEVDNNSDSILLHSRIKATAEGTKVLVKSLKANYTFDPTPQGEALPSQGSGFTSISPDASWIEKFVSQVKPIGPADVFISGYLGLSTITQNKACWCKHPSGKTYLTLIKMVKKDLTPLPTYDFISFIDTDLKDIALSRAGQYQQNGVEEISWNIISGIPKKAISNTAQR